MGLFEKVKGEKDEHEIKLFTLSTCSWCKKTKKLLKSLDLEYHYCDLDQLEEEREKAREKMKEFNSKGNVPTIVIDDGEEVIVGYKEDKIKEALEIE